ncbi:MAG TPA: DUF2330 domain-containing protein [Thermoanaerobaculia bacterium]|nr:DUF2330 domain-containing protein [Thermoanaerobaculia bacterium]
MTRSAHTAPRPARRGPMPAVALVLPLLSLAGAGAAAGFCGFYVAKADTHLYNRASQVVLVRDGDRTVMTMANDFQGKPQEFAMVIPVPVLLERGQIHVADKALIDHLDAWSSPRLVEYFDPDPCRRELADLSVFKKGEAALPATPAAAGRTRSLGVKIEAAYTVGEYDILILSARQSDGLEIWLRENGYQVPAGASRVLGSYIRQGLHFFVAKVNLEQRSKLGFSYLRPLQIAYESPRFMLPIRLGMVNAAGPQELFIYALTRRGRVETTNYRTVKLPSGDDVPLFVKDDFGTFYKALFDRQVVREEMRTVFLEYAWDMSWCDPCAADPLSPEELGKLGVFWLDGGGDVSPAARPGRPGGPASPSRGRRPSGGGSDVFLTRLHLRYDAPHFPEDLAFQETGDRDNFQGRYVLRHAWKGGATCEAAAEYRRELRHRWDREARNLAELTGWNLDDVRRRMNLNAGAAASSPPEEPWWKRLWDR